MIQALITAMLHVSVSLAMWNEIQNKTRTRGALRLSGAADGSHKKSGFDVSKWNAENTDKEDVCKTMRDTDSVLLF